MYLARMVALLLVVLAPAVAMAEPGGAPDEKGADQATDTTRSSDAQAVPNSFVSGSLRTVEPDQDFGQRAPAASERFAGPQLSAAPVDRRRDINPMSDRNILAPMALTPPAGTVSFTNVDILGNYLTYAPTDRLAVTAGAVVPLSRGDFVGSLSVKYTVYKSSDLIVSVLPFGAGDRGTRATDTYQWGVGAGVFADVPVVDTVVLSAGAAGYLPIDAGYDRYACSGGGDVVDVPCATDTTSTPVSTGGRWFAGTLGARWYLLDNFALSGELIMGGSWGTFLGIGDVGNDVETLRDRIENPDFAFGVPHGQGPIVSVSGTWAGSKGRTALQFALVLLHHQDDPQTLVTDESQRLLLLPMLSATLNF